MSGNPFGQTPGGQPPASNLFGGPPPPAAATLGGPTNPFGDNKPGFGPGASAPFGKVEPGKASFSASDPGKPGAFSGFGNPAGFPAQGEAGKTGAFGPGAGTGFGKPGPVSPFPSGTTGAFGQTGAQAPGFFGTGTSQGFASTQSGGQPAGSTTGLSVSAPGFPTTGGFGPSSTAPTGASTTASGGQGFGMKSGAQGNGNLMFAGQQGGSAPAPSPFGQGNQQTPASTTPFGPSQPSQPAASSNPPSAFNPQPAATAAPSSFTAPNQGGTSALFPGQTQPASTTSPFGGTGQSGGGGMFPTGGTQGAGAGGLFPNIAAKPGSMFAPQPSSSQPASTAPPTGFAPSQPAAAPTTGFGTQPTAAPGASLFEQKPGAQAGQPNLFGGQTAPAASSTTAPTTAPSQPAAASLFPAPIAKPGSSDPSKPGVPASPFAGATTQPAAAATIFGTSPSKPGVGAQGGQAGGGFAGMAGQKPGAQAILEESKKQILNRKRIQDVVTEWKQTIDTQYQSFQSLGHKTVEVEKQSYESHKELLMLNEIVTKLVTTSNQLSENLDLIINEQNELNSGLQAIEQDLDRELERAGISSLYLNQQYQDERENVYVKANIVKKNIDEIEGSFNSLLQGLNEGHDEEVRSVEGDVERSLDVYLDALNWIESNVYTLDARLNALEREYQETTQQVYR